MQAMNEKKLRIISYMLLFVVVVGFLALTRFELLSPNKHPKITFSKYQKIRNGMSLDKVQDILGPPTSDKDIQVGVNAFQLQAFTWKKGKRKLCMVTFENGKVVSKFQIGLR